MIPGTSPTSIFAPSAPRRSSSMALIDDSLFAGGKVVPPPGPFGGRTFGASVPRIRDHGNPVSNGRKRMSMPPSRPLQPFRSVGQLGDVIDSAPELPGAGDLPPFQGGPFATPLPSGCSGLMGALEYSHPEFMSASRDFKGTSGNFMNIVPHPSDESPAGVEFWQAADPCLWWIIAEGHLPDTTVDYWSSGVPFPGLLVAPETVTRSDLYHRMKHCHPPPIRDGCLYPESRGDQFDITMDVIDLSPGGDPRFPCKTFVDADDWESAIRQALNLLRQNLDIVQWIGCILEQDLSACMSEILFGGNVSFTITLEPLPEAGGYFDGRRSSAHHVHLGFDTLSCRDTFELFRRPATTRDEQIARDCALMGLAALLFHELTHFCAWRSGERYDFSGDVTDVPGTCDLSYMAAELFTWAMAARYPWLQGDHCVVDHPPLDEGP